MPFSLVLPCMDTAYHHRFFIGSEVAKKLGNPSAEQISFSQPVLAAHFHLFRQYRGHHDNSVNRLTQ